MQQALAAGAQQVGFGAGAQQVGAGAQQLRDRFTLQQRTFTLQQRLLQRLNIFPQRSLQRFIRLPLNSFVLPQQELHVLHELQQVLGAGAQQAGLGVQHALGAGAQQALGAGAQQVGLGVQHFLGAGAQQVGAGAQQPLLPKPKPRASALTPAQQTTARAAT